VQIPCHAVVDPVGTCSMNCEKRISHPKDGLGSEITCRSERSFARASGCHLESRDAAQLPAELVRGRLQSSCITALRLLPYSSSTGVNLKSESLKNR
jgi:hypothetical protein